MRAVVFAVAATGAQASETDLPDLRWCIPFAKKTEEVTAEPQNFQGEDALKEEYEEKIRAALKRAAEKPELLIKLTFALKNSFRGIEFVRNRDLMATTCGSSRDWVIGMNVPRETVTDVTLCVTTANARNLTGRIPQGMDRCEPNNPEIEVSEFVTLSQLVAIGDDVFNRALGSDMQTLANVGDHIRYRIMYHDADIALMSERLGQADQAVRQALERRLKDRAEMMMSQFIRVGLAPIFDVEVGDVASGSNGRSASKTVDPLYNRIALSLIIPDSKALYFDPGHLVISANLRPANAGVDLCTTCEDDEAETEVLRRARDTYLRPQSRADAAITADHPAPAQRDVLADAAYINADPSLTAEVFDTSGPTLLYRVQPVSRLPNGKLSLGAGYSEADGWSVPFSLDWAVPGEPGHTLSLDLTAKEFGWEGKGRFRYALPTQDPGSTLAFEIGVTSGEDRDRLFGNTTGLTVTETVRTLDLGILHHYSSLSYRDRQRLQNIFVPIRDRSAPYYSSRLRAGLRYQDISLKGVPAAIDGLDEGRSFALYLKGDLYRDSYLPFVLPSNGNRNLAWITQYDAQAGFGGSSDDPFVRLALSSDLRGSSFSDGASSAFFRVGVMGGWVSGSAPTFAYLDAAAPLFFSGLRQQEIMARSLIGLKGELGFDISRLFASNGSGGNSNDGTPATPARAEDFVQSRTTLEILVSAFAETGLLWDRLQDGVVVSGSRRVDSFGIKLTTRQLPVGGTPLELNLGYSYSPQSIYEDNGLFFLRLNKTF